MSMAERIDPIACRPVHPVSARQFNMLGMIKVAHKALRDHGDVVTLQFEDGSNKTLLAAPRHGAFWRRNSGLFFKDLGNPQSAVSAARTILGRNLLTTTEGETWKQERKLTLRNINLARPWFDRSLQAATNSLAQALLNDPDTPVLEHCVKWSRRISCDALLGTGALEEEADQLVQCLNRAFLENMAPAAMQEARSRTAAFFAKTVSEHGPHSLAGHLLEQGTDIPARLESDVLGLLAASLHINALSLFWTLQQISTLPAVQQKLRAEAAPLGTSPRRISNAPYAFAVTQEAQRLRPSMAFIERQVRQAFTLDDHAFSPGETVLFSPWFAHRDPAAWVEPDRFDPDRFLDPKGVHDGSYMPFGLGPRMCPGSTTINRHIAYAISRLAMVLDLVPGPKTRPGDLAPIFRINLEPRGPVCLAASLSRLQP